MYKFRMWLATLIAPNPRDNPLTQLLRENDPKASKSGVDFNIRRASNGYVLTTTDWERALSPKVPPTYADFNNVRVVADGDNIIDHVAAILVERQLK